MTKSGEFGIGIIGPGGRGSVGFYTHKPEEGVRVVAGCDVVEKGFDELREKCGEDVFTTNDYRVLLEKDDVDAVVIGSPDNFHEEQALAALEADKAIYLEKPMAITIEGCDRILETAMKHKGKLYVGHNMRHFPVIQKMKELIDTGAIGEPKVGWCRHFISYGGDAYFKDWHAEREKSTGMLLQKGSHDIDVMHWLLHGYTQEVTAMGELTLYGQIKDRHDPSERGDATFGTTWPPLTQTGMHPIMDIEDVSMMLMKLDNGVLASYQQCHYTPDAQRNYTIIGTEGRIENFGDDPKEALVRLWNTRTYFHPEGDVDFTFTPEDSAGHAGADPRIMAEFIRFARDGGKITTSAIGARQAVAAGVMATLSMRNGSQLYEIPPLPKGAREYFDPQTL